MQPFGKQKLSEKRVLLASRDQDEVRSLCLLLEKEGYRCLCISSLRRLEEALRELDAGPVLLDLDTLEVDNRVIRNLAVKHPERTFLCTSASRFHPELKDAISYHIFACLTKPVDCDELLYWLKCIGENEGGSRAPP